MHMYMNASILDAQVGGFFDGVEVNLYDLDEKETYKGLITDGLGGLADLRQLKKQNQPLEVLQEAAAQVEMPLLMQPVGLVVKRVKANKGFLKLVCRLADGQ